MKQYIYCVAQDFNIPYEPYDRTVYFATEEEANANFEERCMSELPRMCETAELKVLRITCGQQSDAWECIRRTFGLRECEQGEIY